jgi:hypothetical protein
VDIKKTSVDDLPGDDWETKFTKHIVRNILRYKDELGLSTAALAEKYSQALGSPGALKPTTLNNLLAGKRARISVTEVILFARALDVAPIALIFSSKNESLTYLPDWPSGSLSIDGLASFVGDVGNSNAFFESVAPFNLVRQLNEQYFRVNQLNYELIAYQQARARSSVDAELSVPPVTDLVTALEYLALLRKQTRESGIRTHALPEYLAFVDGPRLDWPSRLPITLGLPPKLWDVINRRTDYYVRQLENEANARRDGQVPGGGVAVVPSV